MLLDHHHAPDRRVSGGDHEQARAPDDDGADGTTDETAPPAHAGLLLVGTLLVGLAVVLLAAGLVALGQESTDHRFVIPEGTDARLDAGEDVDVIPQELDVQVGDTLTVVNHDVVPHFVGVSLVPPGEVRSYPFPSPGTFQSACTVHPRGNIDITVSA